ncbi:hypothetical protein [Micromonospora deserti]|uniref:Uncharacterized protein n=1 Tax=Micromonospora deserti TaxID=2070366 RepID=A0A2W2DWA8_9ACTN|nr:hypothetical protein [Micromonospora deserti]PZG01477.1 hypothetical protein C1I99_07085 [Micromonospora deserti]
MSTEILAIIGALTGVVGALTGVVSLAWQILVHRRSGRLVSVTSAYIMRLYGPPHAPEYDDDQVAIIVSNRGGAPVTVTNYGVAMGGKGSKKNLFVTNPPAWATSLPAAVAPGGEPAQLLAPVADLMRVHEEHGIPFRKMRPWVDLGDGRRVYSKKAVPLR